jgi:hypothetical protein
VGSSPVDAATQKASSTAAQTTSATQAANAQKQQANSDAAYKSQFGTQGADGTYSGGTVSQFLNPSSLNQTGLNSTYGNAYRTAADQTNKTGQQAVSSTIQNLNNRGMGTTPAGFSADQQRQALQTAADTNAKSYTGLSTQQYQDALNNYWNAQNMLNSYGSGQAQLATSNNQGSSGTNTSLYGTSSQQKQNPLIAGLGAVAGAGSAAITKYCWIAEAVYGADNWRTHFLRAYLSGTFRKTLRGKATMAVYGLVGKPVAAMVRRSVVLRRVFKPLFDMALNTALHGGA